MPSNSRIRVKRVALLLGLLALLAGLYLVWRADRGFPERDGARDEEAVLRWFEAHQGDRALLASDEKAGNAYTYDQALAAIVFTAFDRPERAGRILDYFAGIAGDTFEGFRDFYPMDGHEEPEARAGGPNAWILLAVNLYTARTGDTRFVPLGEKVAEWLMTLSTREGGLAGGYGKWGEPMSWMAVEHNLDYFAAMRDFSVIAGRPEFAREAARSLRWMLAEPLNRSRPHPGIGRQDPNFATDIVSWGVLALGTPVAWMMPFAETMALTTREYAPVGTVTGFDFGSGYADTTWPDRDAVWFEGTGQMVCAYNFLRISGKAAFYLEELRRALTPSALYDNAKGLPYASNPGTPPYAGWVMPADRLCISSAAWFLFASRGINPFSAFDNTEVANPPLFEMARDLPATLTLPLLDDFQNVSSLALGASYRAAGAASATWSIRSETIDGGTCARLDFAPKGETSVYAAYRNTAAGVPRARFVRTFPGESFSTDRYRTIEMRVFADGSRNAFFLELLADDSVVRLARWNLAPAGWRTLRAIAPRAHRVNGFAWGLEGEDITGSSILVESVAVDEVAVTAAAAADSAPPAAGLVFERLTGFESAKVLFGGSANVYGAAETDWKREGPKSWYVGPDDREGYDARWVHEGMTSFRILWRRTAEKAWATFSLLLGASAPGSARPAGADLSEYRRLIFWVRGGRGGETFQMIFRTADAHALDPDVYGPTFTAEPFWTRVEVDLDALLATHSRKVEMIGVNLDLERTPEGEVYTDDWWLERM
jgi:cellulose synthase operon protein B